MSRFIVTFQYSESIAMKHLRWTSTLLTLISFCTESKYPKCPEWSMFRGLLDSGTFRIKDALITAVLSLLMALIGPFRPISLRSIGVSINGLMG